MDWLTGRAQTEEAAAPAPAWAAPAWATDSLPKDDAAVVAFNAVDGGEYSAADADAVAELEADLSSTFEEMESAIANPPAVSSPLKQLRAGIRNVVKQQAILKHGFLAHHFFEQEGSDAMLEVPKWISYRRISGYRYRLVTEVSDPDDEFELYQEHVMFFGTPGASGWADKVGDVAIHYMGHKWAVFSKIFPFAEQGAARETHEDALLLGSIKHVMLTPRCAYRIGVDGLGDGATEMQCLSGDGGTPRIFSVGKAPIEALRRLYLTWGHLASDYATETERLKFDLQAVIEQPESRTHLAKRLVGSLFGRLANGGRQAVSEHWMRYPAEPLEPAYYAQLLATAVAMSEEEQRARAMMEPRETPRPGKAAASEDQVLQQV